MRSVHVPLGHQAAASMPGTSASCGPAAAHPELFSVAPMMAHTHRHYRYFFRLISEQAWLYTEMVPASQCQSPDAEVLKFHECEHPVALQLGGHDIGNLASATRIATELGYDAINLNCGCPSPHVTSGARRGGAAMMREPDHVADCVGAMVEAARIGAEAIGRGGSPPLITVKHRLSVRDDTPTMPYDREADLACGYDDDLASARRFIETVAAAGATRFQVHARKGLLMGNGGDSDGGGVWVPRDNNPDDDVESDRVDDAPVGKVDHKRLAVKRQKQARSRTLSNRSIPPLRPGIVSELAGEFPGLELVSNGGVDSMAGVMERMRGGVHGVMVGRAVINHPALFAGVDKELYKDHPCSPGKCLTRGDVLRRYIEYAEAEEALMEGKLRCMRPDDRDEALRRIVSPAFSLFVGEAGSDRYQRRIRSMSSRFRTRPFLASDVLKAAQSEVEVAGGSLEVPLASAVQMEDLEVYERAVKRAGTLQRMIF